MVFKRLAQENGVFYSIYIEKEQIAETKINHATRKSLGHIFVLGLWALYCAQ
jgi:hypothetical protein